MARERPKRAAGPEPAKPPIPTPRYVALVPWAAGLVAFVVYVPRVCPTLALMGDSAVFTSAAVEWGVPQPSGYPLFTLIGHAFAMLPFGDPAWRVNVSSAVFHAAAVGVVADVLRRLTGSIAASLTGALFLSFSSQFFLGSLYAEAFPLNDLMTSVAIASALAVDRAHAARAPEQTRWRRLVAFIAVAAIASTHHQMIALTAPGLVILALPAARDLLAAQRRRLALLVAMFMAIVATGYALVLLASSRDPYTNWGDVNDLASLVQLATRQDYGGLLSPALVKGGGGGSERIALLASATTRSFGPIGSVLALVGIIAAIRSARRIGVAFLLLLLTTGPVFVAANAIPISDAHGSAFLERFFTMSHVVVALFIGLGAAAAEHWALAARLKRAVVAPVVGLAWLAALLANARDADLRHDVIGDAFARDLVRPIEERGVALVVGDDMIGASTYACAVLHLCDGRALLAPGQLHMSWRVRQLRRRFQDLRLPETDGRSPRASEILAANADPTYASAALLDLDPAMRESFEYLPDGVLLEIVRSIDANARDALVARARAMLDGRACAGCDPAIAGTAATPLDVRVVSTYVTALENHAKLLDTLLGDSADAEPVRVRAIDLDRIAAQK